MRIGLYQGIENCLRYFELNSCNIICFVFNSMRSTLSMSDHKCCLCHYETIRTIHFNFKVTWQKYSSRASLSAHLHLHKSQQSLFNLGFSFQMPFLQQCKEHTGVFLQTPLHNGSLVRRLQIFSPVPVSIMECAGPWVKSYGSFRWPKMSVKSLKSWVELCQISPGMGFSSHLR